MASFYAYGLMPLKEALDCMGSARISAVLLDQAFCYARLPLQLEVGTCSPPNSALFSGTVLGSDLSGLLTTEPSEALRRIKQALRLSKALRPLTQVRKLPTKRLCALRGKYVQLGGSRPPSQRHIQQPGTSQRIRFLLCR